MIPTLAPLPVPVLPFPVLTATPVVAFDAVLEAQEPFVPSEVATVQAAPIDPENLGLRQNNDQDEPKPTAIDEPTAVLLKFLGVYPQKLNIVVGGPDDVSTKSPLQDEKDRPVDASPPLPAPELSPEPVVTPPQPLVVTQILRVQDNIPIPKSVIPAKAETQQGKGLEGAESRPRVGDEEALALSDVPEKPNDRIEVEVRPDDVVVARPPATDVQPPATLGLAISIGIAPTPPSAAEPIKDYVRTIPDTVDRPPPNRKPYEIKPKPIVITPPSQEADEPAPAIIFAAVGVKEAPQIAAPLAPNTSQAAPISSPPAVPADPIRFVVERQLDLARDSRWLDELARDIVSVGERSDRLSFRLMPTQLGRLDVDLSTSDSGLSVRIATTSDAAAQIVTAAQPRLIDELKGQGVRIAGTEVSSGGTQSQGQGQQHQQHSAEHMIEYARRAFGAIDDINLTRPSGRFA